MSYSFPAGFYGDVRIEDVFETGIQATLGDVEEMQERAYNAAFVRVSDGGTAAGEHYLITDGKLAGRLHSGVTAAALDEDLTGNAPSINLEYEPIVRMTTTYIKGGESTLDELIAGVAGSLGEADDNELTREAAAALSRKIPYPFDPTAGSTRSAEAAANIE